MNNFYPTFKHKLASYYSDSESKLLFNTFQEYYNRNKSKITVQEEQDFYENCIQELQQGKPYQHIIGEAYFYGKTFVVNEFTLIPRPETEELIEWIVQENTTEPKKILDIGTGSGIIAIMLKKHFSTANVTALDVSEKALEIAQKNATLHQTEITFLQENFLHIQKIKTTEKWNIIVSNPPYIKEEEKANIPENVVNFEPENALFVPNEKPLLFYEKIIAFSQSNLAEEGTIYVEINQNLAEETRTLFQEYFHSVELRKDISGNYRMIKASKLKFY